jgi:hypothetical protein
VTHAGACTSKNVGTSNRKEGEIPSRRKIKVSQAMVIILGLVGPKGMANAVPDGFKVNIPLLPIYAMEGRRVVCRASYWIDVCVSTLVSRQIRKHA